MARSNQRPEFSSTQYEFAHGSKPRGEGNWVFFFDGDEEDPFRVFGMFSAAKAKAMAEARVFGFSKVEVGS